MHGLQVKDCSPTLKGNVRVASPSWQFTLHMDSKQKLQLKAIMKLLKEVADEAHHEAEQGEVKPLSNHQLKRVYEQRVKDLL
jgi:type I restriction-modification system DNA methylase subunit